MITILLLFQTLVTPAQASRIPDQFLLLLPPNAELAANDGTDNHPVLLKRGNGETGTRLSPGQIRNVDYIAFTATRDSLPVVFRPPVPGIRFIWMDSCRPDQSWEVLVDGKTVYFTQIACNYFRLELPLPADKEITVRHMVRWRPPPTVE